MDDAAYCELLANLAPVAALIVWRVENGLQLFLAKLLNIKNGKVRTTQEAYLAIAPSGGWLAAMS